MSWNLIANCLQTAVESVEVKEVPVQSGFWPALADGNVAILATLPGLLVESGMVCFFAKSHYLAVTRGNRHEWT